MRALAVELSKELERAVIEARDVAEAGARAALEALAVHHYQPYSHMSPEERILRNRLRAHAKQLGHAENGGKTLEIDHIIQECAYEQWHRMLFARFLAENDLLIEPESGVAVSLDECEELAREAGTDLWTMASRFAQAMLPQIFRPDEPVLQILLPREYRTRLEGLVEGLSREVFLADDSLGWVYQFWQTKRKKQVNDSGVKIGADELPAVTQLFTEDYMVEFLLHNTLGAWWAGKSGSIKTDTEEEARGQAELTARDGAPAILWTYLRFVQDEATKTWLPAAGTFDAWPKSAALIRLLDPCMGSGHFLVFALPMLVRLRMEEEKLSAQAAVVAVLKDNIHGLELDERCTQIAAFNVALTAWKLGGFQALPSLNLACSGLQPSATEEEWTALAGDNDRLRSGMKRLYGLFKDAPVLGSLINPRAQGGDLVEAEFHELQPLLEKALAQEVEDSAAHEMAVTAQGLAKAAEILAGQFTLVTTNVPFLGYREMDELLVNYVSKDFPDEKGDLGYCLWRRFQSLVGIGGTIALVTLQHWLSLKSYEAMRAQFLAHFGIEVIAHLGTGAFETISGAKVNVTLTIANKSSDPMAVDISLADVAKDRSPNAKARSLQDVEITSTTQRRQYTNPDHRISFGDLTDLPCLSKYADCLAGIMNGDSPKFIRYYWEIPAKNHLWAFLQSTAQGTQIGGLESIISFDENHGHLREDASIRRVKLHNADERGNSVWGRSGVAIGQMSSLPSSRYFGNKYDSNVAAVVPKRDDHLTAIWAFCTSPDFLESVRAIDRKLNVTNATFGKVPFDLAHWQKVAAEKYPDGLPKPYSDDPTQWLFHGHPVPSTTPLHVATARLLGYRWPAGTDGSMELSSEAREWIDRCKELDEYSESSGIVCIPSVRGQEPASERLRALLAAAFGGEWGPGKERELLQAAGSTAEDLEGWLRSDFFEQHCKLFHHRPFVWHIWDGRNRDGFHVLINYHRLCEGEGKGRKLLESLTYSYLGDWIYRQQDGVRMGAEGAEGRLAAALALQSRLAAIIEGKPPFDVFVRWKPLHEQPIGWHPDINDGIRLNIRPFLVQDLPNGRTGAGLLRWKPNIKWGKDRGNEPERPRDQFPWFWKDRTFTGERVNDIHLDIATKVQARDILTKGGH